MQLHTREHYGLIDQFETEYRGHFRLDREPKEQWPRGYVYQDGQANERFLAYRRGYALAKALYQEPG